MDLQHENIALVQSERIGRPYESSFKYELYLSHSKVSSAPKKPEFESKDALGENRVATVSFAGVGIHVGWLLHSE